jgi:2-oxo-4-hydroxy-4-carboxy-5-ureidoimidazoline decarboxylase
VSGSLIDIAAFDAVSPTEAAALLRPACASHAWIAELVAGRPYGSLDALAARSDATIDALDWDDVEEALAAHPRIGERAAGNDREAAWSRQEQSKASDATTDIAEALRAGNVAYQDRFGHVFLICATGRTSDEMLTALTERLTHDEATERTVVRRELAAIVRLRLGKTFT